MRGDEMPHSLKGNAKRLTAYLGIDDTYSGMPLHEALLKTARIQSIAGATVQQAIAGFGASSRSIERHGYRMSTDSPVIVTVVDEEARIRALAEVWSHMMSSGLITIEDTHVFYYQMGEDE